MRDDKVYTSAEIAVENRRRIKLLKDMEKAGMIDKDQTAIYDPRNDTGIGVKRLERKRWNKR